MAKIKVNLNDIDQAIKEVEDYERDIKRKVKIFLEKLAELGIGIAEWRLETAEYSGESDAEIEKQPVWISDNKLAISAVGSTVAFIEFGTGVHYPSDHPKANELGAIRGSYGKGQGKNKRWGYYGDPANIIGTDKVRANERGTLILTRGSPANRFMYDTAQDMRKNISRIAREVFRD